MKKYLLTALLTISVFIPSFAHADIQTSLISCWSLEESSGSRADGFGANPLTSNNSVTNGTGVVGNAGSFLGSSNQWLSHADNADLSADGTDFSISLWFKATSATGPQAMISKNAAGEYAISIQSSGTLTFGTAGGGGTNPTITWGTPITAGTWYHVVGTYKNNGSTHLINLYVNGVPVGALTGNVQPSPSSGDLTIGNAGSGVWKYTGLIDEVGYWKKVLSATEVSQLYNAGVGFGCPFSVPTPPSFSSFVWKLGVSIAVKLGTEFRIY